MRRPRFGFADDADPNWTPHRPEFACAANSVSVLLPFMEPYFARSVGAVAGDLSAADGAEARAYAAQEVEHHRQHRRYNQLLRRRYRGLAPIEGAAHWTYRKLERSRSAGFNVAFTAASETIAYSAARWAADRRSELFDGADPALAEVFIWHLAEEVEHKSAAWNVHRAIGGGRRRYAGAAVLALAIVAIFVAAGTAVMITGERRLHNPVAWARLSWWATTFSFEVLTNLAMALTADHHPDQFADPLWYEVWLREHPEEVGSGR